LGGDCLPETGQEKEFPIRLQSGGKEVAVAAIAQVAETDQHNVSRPRSFREFVGPSAAELLRIIEPKPGDCLFAQTDERANSFARLLNRGSSLE
jgi:hypothetical protein